MRRFSLKLSVTLIKKSTSQYEFSKSFSAMLQLSKKKTPARILRRIMALSELTINV